MYADALFCEVSFYVFVSESCESVFVCYGDVGDVVLVCEVEQAFESFSVLVESAGVVFYNYWVVGRVLLL